MAKFHHIWSCYIKLLSKVILHKPAPPMCFASLLTLTIRIRNWMAIRMMNMLACRCLAGWYSCWLVLLRRHASLWMRISWSGWHGSRLLRLSRSRGLRYPNHLIMNWKQRTTSMMQNAQELYYLLIDLNLTIMTSNVLLWNKLLLWMNGMLWMTSVLKPWTSSTSLLGCCRIHLLHVLHILLWLYNRGTTNLSGSRQLLFTHLLHWYAGYFQWFSWIRSRVWLSWRYSWCGGWCSSSRFL